MAVEAVVRILPGGARCVDAAQASRLEDLVGQVVRATFTRSRNLDFHRKFFALLEVTRPMADATYNREQWRAIVIAGAGYCDFVPGPDGRLVAVPRSISFANMDDVEFGRLYSDALDFICSQVQDTRDNIEQLVEFM